MTVAPPSKRRRRHRMIIFTLKHETRVCDTDVSSVRVVRHGRDARVTWNLFGRALLSLVTVLLLNVGCQQQTPLKTHPDGILLPVADSFVRLQVCSDDVIRVMCSNDPAFFNRATVATEPKQIESVKWTVDAKDKQTTLSTARLKARVDHSTGAVTFLDSRGNPLAAERQRTLTPATVQGEKTFHVQQQWQAHSDEALYGLGQHQLGLLNVKGYDLDLWQHNGTVVVPMLVSSRGYGILWDNTSYTRFGDLRDFEPIRATGGFKASFYAGANFERLVATRVDHTINIPRPEGRTTNARIHPDLPRGEFSVIWEGDITPAESGEHLIQTFSNAGIRLLIDNRLVIEHWRQGWLPWKDIVKMNLQANRRYRVRLEWSMDQGDETVQLLWKTPASNPNTSLWSEVGEGIDYYFIHGPELDQVVARYRELTGRAPMMPVWAMGLWQSRQRYKTQQEVLDVLEGYRSRQIPIDTIVQDWFYWKQDQWGSHQFDPERFPNPTRWIRDIHDRFNARLMISVWPKFYPQTENAKEMQARGFLYQPNLAGQIKDWLGYVSTFYDAFNPEARKLFWAQINRELMSKGVDAWWLDATEPDLTPRPTLEGQRSHVHPTAMGTGARVLNAYSLLNSEAIYSGQREVAPNKRVFILTRSGFAGQQRYAAATWSGDISSTWAAFRRQIPAGLGFCISGIPWWTTDIGGFSVPPKFSKDNPKPEDIEEWRELNARWFQFSAFCPLLRVHGESPNREMWEFGGEYSPTYQTQLKFDRLRYRLLPYVYSLAGAVTHEHATIMRPLVMDFRTDATAQNISDQYLFGPAFLVSPVTTYKARSRPVYLPSGTTWYDFWTGQSFDGGKSIDAPAPFDSMPLHVRAGSIIPFGPEIQYTAEKKPDPITLFVYTGADGQCTLYEDEGVNYNYEKGALSRIPIRWSESDRTLRIGRRDGAFPGMLKDRTFEIVFIDKRRPIGFSFTPAPDRIVRYSGEAVEVSLKDLPIYLDPTQSIEARVDDLLPRLTLEEKISLLHGDSKFTTPAILRLGIPTRWLSDGPHGVREDIGPDTWRPVGRTDDFSTWLPVAMCLASTFDADLAQQYGQVIGAEALKRGKHIMLGPAVNIQRTPLCGRNFEYMGEDPFLTARLAVGYITGIQSQHVAACVKHFAANNQETQRGTINIELDDRTLREIYLPAFEAAVKEASVWTVMGAYNKVRGQWCCQNEMLLTRILKGEWGFKGLVMSDWAAVHDTREAATHGLDLEMGTEKPYDEYYLARPFREGIEKGEYSVSLLDDKVRRNLRVMIATHALDARGPGAINTAAHQAVARQVAEGGIVLLKNESSALPLDADRIRSIAVIGDNATRKTGHGGGSAEIKAFYEITPLEGILARAGQQVNVTFSQGYRPPAPPQRGATTQPATAQATAPTAQSSDDLIERAVAAARAADVAIVFGGLNHSRNQDAEGTDRRDLKLPWGQDELIRRVVEANPRTIVVIKSGAAVEMDAWIDHVPAVLQAWYPGMEGGHALARILFGDVNPSGKLPCTFPKKLTDSPAHALGAFPGRDGTETYEEGLLVGYRWFDTKQIEPLFPFGHGLSYTSFEYSNLKISGADTPTVTFDITNTGSRAGAEVAQLYVQDERSSLPRPIKELKGFRRVMLKPGQKQTVTIPLDRRALAFYDPSRGWVAEAGEFTIHVGSSSRDIRLRGRHILPQTWVEQ